MGIVMILTVLSTHYAIAHKIHTELRAKKDLERIEKEFISDTDP
ncbi:MAG: hypothetical protein ACFCA4_10280 [Cyanophyceae cyanobacterium]